MRCVYVGCHGDAVQRSPGLTGGWTEYVSVATVALTTASSAAAACASARAIGS